MESKKRDVFLQFHKHSLRLWRDLVSKLRLPAQEMVEKIEYCMETGAKNVIDSFREQLALDADRIDQKDHTLFGSEFLSVTKRDQRNIWVTMEHLQRFCRQWERLLLLEKRSLEIINNRMVMRMLKHLPEIDSDCESDDEWCVLKL